MNLVTLENVSKQFSERQLLDQINLQINEGDRIGLIGTNGSGKTTLLRMVAGLEPPDTGTVTVRGDVRIRYLPQDPLLDDSLTVLTQLFDSDWPQTRLMRDYEWVSQQLQQNPASLEWQARLAALSDEIDRTDGWSTEAKVKSILTRLGITDFGAPVGTLSGGQRKRVALARALIDPADLLILDEPTNHIDAATIAWLENYLAGEPGALLMVTHDRYFLDRVVNRIVELDRRQLVNYPGNYSRYLELSTSRHEQLVAAEAKRQNLLRRELEWLRRGAQARSTKQKARKQRIEELQQLNYDRGETVHLGYYDQQSSALIDDMRVIDFIEQEAPLIQARDGQRMSAFQVLEWFLFPKPQQYARIGSLSGGERRRLYLLYVLMHRPNVLFLDEPTNDLDIQTLAVLEEFLDHFNGSLIVVSHDRYFLDRTVDYLVSFEDGQISDRYPAPFSTYQKLREQTKSLVEKVVPERKPAQPAADESRQRARPRKLTWHEQRELAQLEARIEALETEQRELQSQINQSGDDYRQLQTLAGQLQGVEAELETISERWLALSEIAEDAD
jgi:ATPase subunit of ABC transporter with duplicated ATPase domains